MTSQDWHQSHTSFGDNDWQESNERTYTENVSNIVIQVKDKAELITEYETPINITKLDNDKPQITNVIRNPASGTNLESVTLTIQANDGTGSGIAETEGYSFDGGATWQNQSSKTYTKNTAEIQVQVKDKVGNIRTDYPTIEITNIYEPTLNELVLLGQTNPTKGIKPGDYIEYSTATLTTPHKPSTTDTGHATQQIFYPSNYTGLWRVLRVVGTGANATIEIISDQSVR